MPANKTPYVSPLAEFFRLPEHEKRKIYDKALKAAIEKQRTYGKKMSNKTVEITKNEARLLLALSAGRVASAERAVSDMESSIKDMQIKLERANDALESARGIHADAIEILERD